MVVALAKRKGREKPSEAKLKAVENIQKSLQKYAVIGLVNLYKMPAAQLQEMRLRLEGKARIVTAKKSVIQHAIERTKDEKLKALEDYLAKPAVQPALLFTEMNPFLLFKFLEQNKSEAPAKAGDVAAKDIFVKSGETGMPPGPAIGTLSAVGLKTKVIGGKIHILEDKIVAKAGETVTPEVANVLNMLGIRPMEIGLDMIAAYESGLVYDKSVLRIDEVEFNKRLNAAIMSAINLSLNAGYVTRFTADLAIQKAYREARSLALESGVYEKGVIEELLAKHVREYLVLKIVTETVQIPQETQKQEEQKI